MSRRNKHPEHVNHERWLVSYADFITLLFAFFVVMYSVSSINEGKYRVLSESLDAAFRAPNTTNSLILSEGAQANSASAPSQLLHSGDSAIPLAPLHMNLQDSLSDTSPLSKVQSEEDEAIDANEEAPKTFNADSLGAAAIEVDQLANQVEDELGNLIEDETLKITRNQFWLEVEINSNLLFPSGKSQVLPEALPVLNDLSKVLAGKPNRIHIEGYTDTQPINTVEFPSNWELSAARAATVVRLFAANGVDPSLMASIGYGEYHPIADNQTEEGRSKNRRVVVVVMASLDGRQDERIYDIDLLNSRSP